MIRGEWLANKKYWETDDCETARKRSRREERAQRQILEYRYKIIAMDFGSS